MAEVVPPGGRGLGTATALIAATVIVALLAGGVGLGWQRLPFGLQAAIHLVIDHLTGRGGIPQPQ